MDVNLGHCTAGALRMWKTSPACRYIESLVACCVVNLSMGKGQTGWHKKRYKDCTNGTLHWYKIKPKKLEEHASMSETDYTGDPWSSRPLPDLRKRGVRLIAARNRRHSAAPTAIIISKCPLWSQLCVSDWGLQSHLRVHRWFAYTVDIITCVSSDIPCHFPSGRFD